MFHSARLKLTAWYCLMIMIVSVAFSLAIYQVLTQELDRIEAIQQYRVERELIDPLHSPPPRPPIDLELIEETKHRVQLTLALIDVFILGGSALAGYFLAGRTLRPIREMVDDQNQFITDASHELRTPLTSLKTEIEVNLRAPKLTSQEARHVLQSNLEEVNRLQTLSDDLIKLTQYRKGQSSLPDTTVSLLKTTTDALNKVEKIAKAKDITLINKITDVNLKGHETAFCELFVILLDNAIKYSPAHTDISLASNNTDNHVTLKITDQGMGIDPKDLPHIFDRFYRADKSRSSSGASGYGLGLSIAQQIVEKANGTISVKSQPQQGSTFIITLPIDKLS